MDWPGIELEILKGIIIIIIIIIIDSVD